MKVYLARPISGCKPEFVKDYFEDMRVSLEKFGYEVLTPLSDISELRVNTPIQPIGYEQPTITDHAIYERDMWMVEQADILFLYLPNTGNVSIGCVAELIAASRMRKHTVVVIIDENNVHHHAFVHQAADIIFDDLLVAMEYLSRLVKKN